MSITLKVTPETLQKMAGEISDQLTDMEKQFDEIESEISKSRNYWEGIASDTHMNRYNSMKGDISETIKRLRSHPANLLKMAGVYIETETANEQSALVLPDDIIV